MKLLFGGLMLVGLLCGLALCTGEIGLAETELAPETDVQPQPEPIPLPDSRPRPLPNVEQQVSAQPQLTLDQSWQNLTIAVNGYIVYAPTNDQQRQLLKQSYDTVKAELDRIPALEAEIIELKRGPK